MAEQQSSGFTIVDKRSASQATASDENVTPDPASSVPSATDSDSANATTPSSSVENSAPEADPESSLAEGAASEVTSSAEADEPEMPDPALLLSMIGMQMETRTLATALIAIFDGHAWRSLGFIANPATGEVRKDLPSAQLAIDAVAFLLGKIESSLPDSERRDAQRRLSDLRMNYLNKLREA